MPEKSKFFRLNEEYLRELREHLEEERKLRDKHQKRIKEILEEMNKIAEKKGTD